MPRAAISQYFLFILLMQLFSYQCRSKKSREESYSQISRFLSRYFNVNNPTLWISLGESSLHSHNTEVFIVESFLLEVISRSQLPQNSKILCLCFRRRLLQNQCGSDWNITVCAILVSPYSFHELPLPNSMRIYLFVTWKS